jgi:Family of unknown function (DUF6880)
VPVKTTLNAKNLEALGAARLAKLLLEISTGDAAAKRRLRLELAGAQSPGELAKEIRKRLAAIARSGAFVDWRGVRALAGDLDTQRRAIVEKVAEADPKEALDLLWRFMALAEPVFGRCDDSSGTVIDVFREACSDIGDVAAKAAPDPAALADRTYDALLANGYGQFDGLIEALAPTLGQRGLEHLKRRMIELSNRPVRPAEKDRVEVGWSSSGPVYADEMAERSRLSTVRYALQEIADALGDVDAFIEQHDEKARRVPKIAAGIAQRLLSARRVEEAWRTIETAEPQQGGSDRQSPEFEWEDARIDVLEALERPEDAQAARYKCFERSLSASHLRAYLKRLPDFDDIEAETRALDYVERYPNVLQSLSFLVSWPALDRAATLVQRCCRELDGDHYEILAPAADALAGKYPLAATLLLRAMIDFSLTRARSSRYKHAARHLLDCSGLAGSIESFGEYEPHDAYEARLRREHGRKSGFWGLVG